MGRPRKAGAVLASVDDCARAMGELLAAAITEEQAIAKRDELVARVQAKWEPAIDEARKQKAAAEAALEDYYYAHIPEIEKDGAKHLDLGNGRMGRRDNPPALKPLNRSWNWKRITALFQVKFGTRFLREPEPELDREAVKAAKLATEELKQLGVKIEAGETFYAEPARLPAEASR